MIKISIVTFMLICIIGVSYAKGYSVGLETQIQLDSDRSSSRYIKFLESKINQCYVSKSDKYEKLVAYEKCLEVFKDIYKL